jgi:hypothetical protein
MDTNIAAWLAGGDPRIETRSMQREREQLHAFRESRRVMRPSLIDRLRGSSRRREDEIDLVCCTA